MFVHLRTLAAVVLLAASSRVNATVRYTVTLADPVRHLVQVTMELPPGRESHELQLPVWNALYQVRDFTQYINWIRATDLAGASLPLTQVNKSRWRLAGTAKGVRVEYQILSNDPGPYGAELNQKHAFFNLAEILLYSDDTRDEKAEIQL